MLVLALLHPIVNLTWWRWSIHPSTVIGIAALAALYVWGAKRAHKDPTTRQKIYFFSGLLLMFASLNGPLHDLSDDYLFSAHMVQHLLLTLALPPLLLAGVPGWMIRKPLASGFIAPVARFFTRAPIAFVIFNVVIAAWHLPPPPSQGPWNRHRSETAPCRNSRH
jgi:putative membrane protein